MVGSCDTFPFFPFSSTSCRPPTSLPPYLLGPIHFGFLFFRTNTFFFQIASLHQEEGNMVSHTYPLTDRVNADDQYFSDYRAKYYHKPIPIVIDNGSFQCRAGWGDESRVRCMYDVCVEWVIGDR